VAPNCSDGGNAVSVWLPKGNWYYFWDDKKYAGDKTESITAATGVVPAFVKEGALIPMAPFAKSTFFIPKDVLLVHVYTGADGTFQLYEDDGVSEKYRTKGELRTTSLRFSQQVLGVEVGPAKGTFSGAPSARSYQVIYHGLAEAAPLFLNGTSLRTYTTEAGIPAGEDGATWDATKKLLIVHTAPKPVDGTVWISTSSDPPSTGGTGGSATGGAGGGGAPGGGDGGRGGAGGGTTGRDAGPGADGGPVGGMGGSGAATGGQGGGSGGGGTLGAGGATMGATGGSGGSVSGGAGGAGGGGRSGSGGSAAGGSSTASAAADGSGCACDVGRAQGARLWPFAVFLLLGLGPRGLGLAAGRRARSRRP
jgi:hypothetical protein